VVIYEYYVIPAYVSKIDPGPDDPGPDIYAETHHTVKSVQGHGDSGSGTGQWESDVQKSLENPAYVSSIDSTDGYNLREAMQKGDNCDECEPPSYEESVIDVNTALITYQNEQNTMNDFRAGSQESFCDSSYVDSLTSNDSRAALLSNKRSYPVPPVFSSQIINTGKKTLSEHDFNECSVSSRDISNTKFGLFESSAYIDHVSCISPSQRQVESACRNAMLTLSQDIIPQQLQNVPSKLALNKEGVGESIEVNEDDDGNGDFNSIGKHMKNLIFLSISISLMNTAVGSLRNLQSSLNHIDGLGLYSLGASFTGFMIFSLFTPFIVQRFRPKKCLVLSLIPQLLYIFSNVYPAFHVFIPASFLQGVANALLWNAVSTYITYLARSYALQNDAKTVPTASKYFGIFFFFFQFSIVAGNIISSVVLMNGKQGNIPDTDTVIANVTSKVAYLSLNGTAQLTNTFITKNSHLQVCGAKYCHANNVTIPGLYVNDETKYALLGIYGVCVAFALVIALYLLDVLKPYRTAYASCSVVCKQLKSVILCAVDPRFIRLFLLFTYTSMQMSFVAGDVTQVSYSDINIARQKSYVIIV